MRINLTKAVSRAGALVALATLVLAPAASAEDALAYFRAVAVNMSNVGAGSRTGTIDIEVERWTTDEERAALASILVEKDTSSLLDALQKVKPRAGYIRGPQTLGYDLQYAREVVNDDGSRRIVIATDRRIGFLEARNSGRSMDYPFTLIEMRFDKNGKGTGKLAAAVKITYNKEKKTLELENWASEPVRLTQITDMTKKK